jgi:hypothetical protein
VGTTALTLHVTATSLLIGVVGGIVAALACIVWTLRSLRRVSERSLLAGEIARTELKLGAATSRPGAATSRPGGAAIRTGLKPGAAYVVALTLIGGVLIAAGAAGRMDAAGAFFGAGFALLGAMLGAALLMLRRQARRPIEGGTTQALPRLGFRSATYRPGRSVLSMAVIAAATFILISVDAFRRDIDDTDRQSGVGGYAVVVNTLLPIARDPNSAEGREALGLFDLDPAVRFEPFRVRPGDDASCLNLYEPRNPRIVAPTDEFLAAGRFAFSNSLAASPGEHANPWLLLQRQEPDGTVPVIADANSMTYVLHRSLGEELVVPYGAGTLRLKLVAALRDSIFQGELLMSQTNFQRLFPDLGGYQFMLVDGPVSRAPALVSQIEDGLSDLGADATPAAARLAEFHRVENTYLSTFQTLGALGLLLGTVGLASVLLRNVLERRRELALLEAVGYRRAHVGVLILAENALLLSSGLAVGALSAALAVAPAVAERGGRLLSSRGAFLLLAVLATGLLSSVVALVAAARAPLLSSLRSE